jgi:hypothetical protein
MVNIYPNYQPRRGVSFAAKIRRRAEKSIVVNMVRSPGKAEALWIFFHQA